MRADYCPMANEPCQSMCDVPCSAHRLKPADDSDMAVYKAIAKNYAAPQAQQPKTISELQAHIDAQVRDKPCNPHPAAPHGFDRTASHTENRYVCRCEYWEPDGYKPTENEGSEP